MMSLRHFSVNKFQTPLSRIELFEISNDISMRFTPAKPVKMPELGNDIKLTGIELLEVSQNINLYYAPSISSSIKRLVLLPIDPQHLYAYWSLGDNQTNKISQTLIEGQLALRIYSKTKESLDAANREPVIEIAIHEVQARQRIRLPMDASNGAAVYSASIGEYDPENGFVSLLKSNNTHAFQRVKESNDNREKGHHSLDSSHIEYKETRDNLINQAGSLNKVTVYDKPSSVKSHYASSNRSGQRNK